MYIVGMLNCVSKLILCTDMLYIICCMFAVCYNMLICFLISSAVEQFGDQTIPQSVFLKDRVNGHAVRSVT
jgi:hypothetical protein